MQYVADKKSRKIICTSFSSGRKHDFKLFKESNTHIHPSHQTQTDTGYLGIQKQHFNSELPKKRSKKHPLTPEDKKQNKLISSSRVLIENIIRRIKIFKIMADKYRNRRKRFALRANLIAGIYNFELL